jgi:inward rectifier potassium channel
VASARPQQLLDARGRALIERRGVRRQSLANDGYHFLRTGSWTRVIAIFAVLFAVSNLLFALAYWAAGSKISSSTGFLDLYWFSVQSMATIGYGVLAPMDHVANVIVTVEAFYGIVFTAVVTGIVFARFSTPAPRVVFSKVALIAEHDGQRALQFRMANERTTAIVEATVRLYMTREETLANGERFRRVYDLALRRATTPVFSLSFLAVHPIDDKSPLYKKTAVDLRESSTNFIVTFMGIDDGLASTVHSRYLWSWNDIVYDERFVDVLRADPDGKRYIDLAPIHDSEPVK